MGPRRPLRHGNGHSPTWCPIPLLLLRPWRPSGRSSSEIKRYEDAPEELAPITYRDPGQQHSRVADHGWLGGCGWAPQGSRGSIRATARAHGGVYGGTPMRTGLGISRNACHRPSAGQPDAGGVTRWPPVGGDYHRDLEQVHLVQGGWGAPRNTTRRRWWMGCSALPESALPADSRGLGLVYQWVRRLSFGRQAL